MKLAVKGKGNNNKKKARHAGTSCGDRRLPLSQTFAFVPPPPPRNCSWDVTGPEVGGGRNDQKTTNAVYLDGKSSDHNIIHTLTVHPRSSWRSKVVPLSMKMSFVMSQILYDASKRQRQRDKRQTQIEIVEEDRHDKEMRGVARGSMRPQRGTDSGGFLTASTSKYENKRFLSTLHVQQYDDEHKRNTSLPPATFEWALSSRR